MTCNPDNTDTLYGCPAVAMTYDSSICGSASMLGFPSNTPFILEVLPNVDTSIMSCSANGFETEYYGPYDHVYRLRPCGLPCSLPIIFFVGYPVTG